MVPHETPVFIVIGDEIGQLLYTDDLPARVPGEPLEFCVCGRYRAVILDKDRRCPGVLDDLLAASSARSNPEPQ